MAFTEGFLRIGHRSNARIILGNQAFDIIVELYNAAELPSTYDKAMSDQARLGVFVTGKNREWGANKSPLKSQKELPCFRIGNKHLGQKETGMMYIN